MSYFKFIYDHVTNMYALQNKCDKYLKQDKTGHQ